jgi:hypothetical protein
MSGYKIKAALLALAFGSIAGAWAQTSGRPEIDTNSVVSVGMEFSNGPAVDGTNGYDFRMGIIWKNSPDWTNISLNHSPFSSLPNYNHPGAGTDYMSGFKTPAALSAQTSEWTGIDTNIVYSVDMGFSQGWAFDGTNGYAFRTEGVQKFSSNWKPIIQNGTPFSGLTNYNHVGAGTFYEGKLYAAMEDWHGCGKVTNQSIVIFNAGDLRRLSVTVVSNYQNEISAVTVDPDLGANGILFAASFCDGRHLFEYALPHLNRVGTLILSQNIPSIQGIGYHDKLIYVDADSGANGLIYAINPTTGEVRYLTSITVPGANEYEGLDVSQGDFRISEAATKRLYFFHFAQ